MQKASEEKAFWKSKTLWFAVINAALIAFEGPVHVWIAKNPGGHSSLILFGFTLLRLVSTKKVKRK